MDSVGWRLLAVFLCLSCGASNAKNYYFSSKNGNDSYTAIQAQNPLTPWQTINKLNSFFVNVQPGDSILFKKGEIFRGLIVVNRSGTASSPIVLSSFGTGALPVVTLPAVTGWTLFKNGVYSVQKQMWPSISIFYEDNLPLLKMASTSDCTDGKWWCNATTLYYKPGTGGIAGHITTVGNIVPLGDYAPALDLSDDSYITVDGLEFDSFGIGVKTYDTAKGTVGLTIKNSSFSYCQTGIMMMPDTGNNVNATIQNCFFYRDQCGIDIYTTQAVGNRPGQTHGTNTGCKVVANEFSQIGTVDGSTKWTYGTDYQSIGLQNFMNGAITDNYIHDGLQIGIIFYNLSTRSSDNNIVARNRVINNKKGGLILMGDNSDEGASGAYSFNNNFISNNLFVGSADVGNSDGTVIIFQGANTTRMNYFVNNTLSGRSEIIYFPTSRSPYFTIENNIIYNPGNYRFVAWYWPAKPSNFVMDYNLYDEPDGQTYGFVLKTSRTLSYMQSNGLENHSKFINPLFQDMAAVNYQLQKTSPAIDAGVKAGLPYNGIAPDMGAFESAPASIKPPNPPKTTGKPAVY